VFRVETRLGETRGGSPRKRKIDGGLSPIGRTKGQNGATFAQKAKPADWRKHCDDSLTTFGKPIPTHGQVESEKRKK